jgi:hypothetical protein
VGFGLCIWLISKASSDAWLTLLAFFLVGTVLYTLSTRGKPRPRPVLVD